MLTPAAADLILHGDLTGRYATGSYSKLASDGRTVALRGARQGAAEHGHRITAAIACHVARAGGTVDDLTRLLLHPDHEGGRHARHIAVRSGQARALDYIHRVWASASVAVASTAPLESRQHAREVLAALRDRIETTPWPGERGRTALRVLRAHLTFAEIAGGPLHHASERQTAEEAGISRTTLRAVYETVLKPGGWLRRLRVGHGREGSTWYISDGTTSRHDVPAALSRFRTAQYPPDPALEEWHTPETDTGADIDSTVIGRLMGHDAFAHHGLGSTALMILGALRARPSQTIGELVRSASVSRATAYRTLRRLADHGLVHHHGETWSLAPRPWKASGKPGRAPFPTRPRSSHKAGSPWPSSTARWASGPTAGHGTPRNARHTGRCWTGLPSTAAKPWCSSVTAARSWCPLPAPMRYRSRGAPRADAYWTQSRAAPPPTGVWPPTVG
ncbi:hypothetical protein Stsp02_63440 [Streptomyces sp. NBRC 14336]|uniref:helix-turn-helix domain-containing protein n=1 Tax=Streptomyces sp. NBRC 14336 TaxID=3030992 RepID=UPI0024A2F54B|nr:helix-turn-helix domain-containing protein [Streptomyces sp. NBRC 14336]GLW50683.1 hypothetical protein Stsp02_63440 [Streptomyces sp. NBRC 14336]